METQKRGQLGSAFIKGLIAILVVSAITAIVLILIREWPVTENKQEASKKEQPAGETAAPESATQDWLGDPEANAGRNEQKNEIPENSLIAGEATTVVDARVWNVKLASEITENIVWSADGKSIYLLEKKGVLRKIAVPSFVVDKEVSIGADCSWLEHSKTGLLVVVNGFQEVWVVDGDTLAAGRKFPVGMVKQVASCSACDYAFASPSPKEIFAFNTGDGKVLTRINLSLPYDDSVVRKHKDGMKMAGCESVTVTPDGQYLFCSWWETLHRFRISGNDLIYEEAGARIGRSLGQIDISPDSRYVSAYFLGGTATFENHPEIRRGGYIYDVSDLQVPVVTIEQGGHMRTVAYDQAMARLYSQDYDYNLITFDARGQRIKQYQFSRQDQTRRIFVHPAGGKMLVKTEHKLFWVELS